MVDIGAQSSKPGAKEQGILHEKQVLIPLLKSIKQTFPQTIISIDTWHAEIARVAAGEGADIINDISGGTFDNQMFATMAQLQLPYILMHTNGKPDIMQANPQYDNVLKEVIYFMSEQISKLNALGVNDIIVDPGFGFGKNLDHNYQLLSQLNHFSFLETPVLVGISRKSMINKVINTSPDEALNGTSVLHTLALEQGAQILRVHDVKEAKQCIQLFKKNKNSI
jgi:dihydropteroate synthase